MSLVYRIEGSDLQYVEMTLAPGESAVGEPGAMMYADEGVSIETHMGDGDDAGSRRPAGGRLQALHDRRELLHLGVHEHHPAAVARGVRRAFARQDHRRRPGQRRRRADLSEGRLPRRHARAYASASPSRSACAPACSAARASSCSGSPAAARCSFTPAARWRRSSCAPASISRWTPAASRRCRPRVNYDVKYVGSLKTSVLGGEGLFLASLKGPGTVWLQSLPIQRLRPTLSGMSQSRGLAPRLMYFALVIFIVIATHHGWSFMSDVAGLLHGPDFPVAGVPARLQFLDQHLRVSLDGGAFEDVPVESLSVSVTGFNEDTLQLSWEHGGHSHAVTDCRWTGAAGVARQRAGEHRETTRARSRHGPLASAQVECCARGTGRDWRCWCWSGWWQSEAITRGSRTASRWRPRSTSANARSRNSSGSTCSHRKAWPRRPLPTSAAGSRRVRATNIAGTSATKARSMPTRCRAASSSSMPG